MNEINVRIKHKYDKYANWLTSEIVLGEGELAIAEIPSQQTFEEPDGSTVLTPPAIGIKVGDGEKKFNELPWIQSTAGDVYAWAKKENLDFSDLNDDFINDLDEYVSGRVNDTNTSYRFAYENDILYIYETNLGQEPSSEATWELPITVSTKVDKVEASDDIEGNIVELTADGNIKNSGKKLDEFLSKEEAEAGYVSLTTYSEMEGTVSGINERLITAEGHVGELIESVAILNGEDEGSVKKQVADAIATIVDNAPENFDTLKEIADFITSEEDGGAAGLINRVAGLEGEVEELKDTTIPQLSSTIEENGNNILDLQEKTSSIEEVLGDETAGLVKSVSDNTNKISEIEEQVSSNSEAVTSAVQTVSVLGMTEEDEAVTKEGTNVEINKIPVSILVSDLTLILNCGNATEVI